MTAPETLYRTEDGKLVPEGHKDAAFLVARKGDFVSVDVAKRYKLSERWADKETKSATVEPKDETPRDTRALSGKTLHKRSE